VSEGEVPLGSAPALLCSNILQNAVMQSNLTVPPRFRLAQSG
jgi:hypothetical protein